MHSWNWSSHVLTLSCMHLCINIYMCSWKLSIDISAIVNEDHLYQFIINVNTMNKEKSVKQHSGLTKNHISKFVINLFSIHKNKNFPLKKKLAILQIKAFWVLKITPAIVWIVWIEWDVSAETVLVNQQ